MAKWSAVTLLREIRDIQKSDPDVSPEMTLDELDEILTNRIANEAVAKASGPVKAPKGARTDG